jgi:hypothetical protein
MGIGIMKATKIPQQLQRATGVLSCLLYCCSCHLAVAVVAMILLESLRTALSRICREEVDAPGDLQTRSDLLVHAAP